MVSSHGNSAKSGSLKDSAKIRRNGDKKSCSSENAARQSPSSSSKKDKEVSRYEFDSKVPKGHRTDREKKKFLGKKHGSEAENAPVVAEKENAATDVTADRRSGEQQFEHSKHLKRLRTGRNSRSEGGGKKWQNRSEQEIVPAQEPEETQVAKIHENSAEDAFGDGKIEQIDAEPAKLVIEEELQIAEGEEEKHEQMIVDSEAGEEAREDMKVVELQNDQEAVMNQVHGLDKEVVPQQLHSEANKATGDDQEARMTEMHSANVVEAKEDEIQALSTSMFPGAEIEKEQEELEDDQKLVNAEPDTSLSLGLSGAGAHRVKRTKSYQTISQVDTFSHGVTTSLSLSCSHPFTHNPSCSLTQTSHDNQEFSSARQPVYQESSQSVGGDGRRFGDHSRHKELSQSRGRAVSESNQYSQHFRPKGSMHKKQVKSGGPSHSAGCSERWSEREKPRFPPFVTVREIVSDPVPLVAQKMQDIPGDVLEELKNSVKDLLERNDRREEFLQLQRILQSRTDLSAEALQISHQVQLEILVALKTGIQAFLLQDNQPKILVEVFMNLRCRNVQCLSHLPVDDCECKICTQKSGFCNACMCVVCSKFDTEHNTCSWVGCDYCIHWCHTDCGLRKSYIKPGPTIRGPPGTSEMQFHCIACGHTSELFGFVKDVFTSCAGAWNRTVLSKELDCARRMFQGSEDMRGKKLCWKAGQLVTKLENHSDVGEACNNMLRFFEDCCASTEEENQGAPARDDPGTVLERATLALQTYDRVLEEKRTDAAEMQYERAKKKAEIEELESIVRIKQAEAKMFQARADEASREAEGLQRIVLAKCLKVEEEYAAKMAKLQLLEAEEKRKRKFENVQLLEAGSYNFDMVRKLMGDLQGLLTNMEAVKRLKAEEVSGVEKYLQRYLQSRAV